MDGHPIGCRVGFGKHVDGLEAKVDQVVMCAGDVGEADEGVAGLQRGGRRAPQRCAVCDGRGNGPCDRTDMHGWRTVGRPDRDPGHAAYRSQDGFALLPGAGVAHVGGERTPPVTAVAAEIGQMLGLGRTRVHVLINDVDFPAPVAELRVGKVWLYTDIAAYAARAGRPVYPLAG